MNSKYRLLLAIMTILVVISVISPQIPPVEAQIADIPAYGVLQPSGCGHFKGTVKLRFDMFMTPDAPYYDKHYTYAIDWDSLEAKDGYPGEADPGTGEPLDWEEYAKWEASLPCTWVNTPFHCHFVYFDSSITDDEVKAKVVEITEYFYALHEYCWENGKPFISEWQKVPVKINTVREPFKTGLESEDSCLAKANDIAARADEFDTRTLAKDKSAAPALNIGEKGTIDVGSPAIDRDSWQAFAGFTTVEGANTANADGTIDTIEIYLYSGQSGNNVKFGTLTESPDNYMTPRDTEVVGEVTSSGWHEFTGLSIDIVTGDVIGLVDTNTKPNSKIERATSGGTETWYKFGDFPTGEYSNTQGAILSIYGTGTEGGCSPSIELSQSSWNVNGGNPVSESSNYATGLSWCTITNHSGGAVTITIGGTDMTGGGYTWDLADDGSPGDMIYGLYAGLYGGDYTIIVKETGPYNTLKAGLGDEATQDFGLKIYTPTNFDDGNQKSGTVTLTAVCD